MIKSLDSRQKSKSDWLRYGDEMRRPLLVNPDFDKSNKIVIVGGGLSGLCCAYRIAEKRPDIEIVVLEKNSCLGGVIKTWRDGEWICDVAVNAARPHPSFWRLVQDLGLSDSFKSSNPKAKARWILINDVPHKLSFLSLFKIGPFKLWRSVSKSRLGGQSVADTIPNAEISDALCLGIVNDRASNVDADFLIPSITGFGARPPLPQILLNRKIKSTYPIFTPKNGTLASFSDGMSELIRALNEKLESLDNVTIKLNSKASSVDEVAREFQIPQSSVVWSAPGKLIDGGKTEISVFAIGYHKSQVNHIELGYGTLIPDEKYPISGILHESDCHRSKRCPEDYRLFRLMVPHTRWNQSNDSVLSCAEQLLAAKPAIFSCIGTQKIPTYKPGHMQNIKQTTLDCTYVGWGVSGVSITHLVAEAERLAESLKV